MNDKPLFITGIGTSVGKTIVSTVLCEQLQADYWKPVQSGDLNQTDSNTVRNLVSNSQTVIHPEAFKLLAPVSPHESAAREGLEILPTDFHLPETANRLIIEGAGGLFVPLSYGYLVSDLISHLGAEVVLVTRNYLGCINHTLLSMHALQTLNIPLKHLVLNGEFSTYTKSIILQHLPVGTTWSNLPEIQVLSAENIAVQPIQLYSF